MTALAAVAADAPAHANQFALLGQRRFAPFFWTQFSGAANDNLFKFAFTVMVTYQLQVSWMPPAMAGLVIGALFILPFLLFSATSGQLADKYDKAQVACLPQVLDARAEGIEAPVIPMALINLWGSFFSRVGLHVGPAAPSADVQPELLRSRVSGLLAA